MTNITIYTRDQCAFCVNAKHLLKSHGVDFAEVDITGDALLSQEMVERSGQRTVPQIFVGDKPIGGFVELARLVSDGKLNLH